MTLKHCVFSFLVERHFGEDRNYSAVFVASEESRTDALRQKFPHHVPPLKPWWQLNQTPGRSPVDLDTGSAARVLSVEADDPENGVVTALGKWFGGDAVAGFYTFELKLDHEVWKMQSVK